MVRKRVSRLVGEGPNSTLAFNGIGIEVHTVVFRLLLLHGVGGAVLMEGISGASAAAMQDQIPLAQ